MRAIPVLSYKGMIDRLIDRFSNASYGDTDVVMVCILFARPTAPLAASELLPNISYIDFRSQNFIDFLCAGYGMSENATPKDEIVGETNLGYWLFNVEKFNTLRNAVEEQTTWRYSGGVDLILTNALFDTQKYEVHLDFRSTVVCPLDQMKKDGAIISVGALLEDIIQFAETASGDDPTFDFSVLQHIEVASSAMKRLILSILPKKLGDDVKKALYFTVKNVSRST